MNILQAIDDPNVFASGFRNRETWCSWFAFLAALFGLPMTPDQLAIFTGCTGRTIAPVIQASEAWLVCGRRAGKSFCLGLIAVFLACFINWRPYLGVGERATVMMIAADRRQARVVMRYIKGILRAVPMLAHSIETERTESIDLASRVTIEVHTASFRTVRGYSICAALLDELAFWPIDEHSASPDAEIINALRPAMATVPGSIMLCASSPYARKGALWEAYCRHWGKDGDPILVWHAPTRLMNPTVPERVIGKALAEDPSRAASEFLAEFRSDVEGYISPQAVEACIAHGVFERSSERNVRYVAFCDPSGGAADSFTMAVAHKAEDNRVIIDVIREQRPPFSPEAVVGELAAVLKAYRVRTVTGDRYGGQFPIELFKKHGVTFRPSDRTKSQLFLELLPKLNSRSVVLLDHDRCTRQLCALERRTGFSGQDRIGHAQHPSAHDDIANAVAGACWLASAELRRGKAMIGFMEGPGCGRITWHRMGEEPQRLRDRVRFVLVDELGNELTADQACALRRGELPNRARSDAAPTLETM